MEPGATTATGHPVYWAGKLFACLQEMALLRSNAVLQILEGVERLESGQRYPASGLGFAGNRWRAFYHCHDAAAKPAGEHGHFHVFTATGEAGWSHVAGLSIDAMGQPLQWFAVNRWVTDGHWLEAGSLLQLLSAATGNTADPLVGRWLLALLQLDRQGLSELLARRDRELELQAGGRDQDTVFADRALYLLATRRIDVQTLLEDALVQPATAAACCRLA